MSQRIEGHTGSIILIVIGVVALLFNLDVLSWGQFKEAVRTYWPILLILVGVIGIVFRSRRAGD